MEKTSSENVVVLYAAAIVSFERKAFIVVLSRLLAEEIAVDEELDAGYVFAKGRHVYALAILESRTAPAMMDHILDRVIIRDWRFGKEANSVVVCNEDFSCKPA